MKWPWSRCNRKADDVAVPPVPEAPTSIEEARAARQKSEAGLRRAVAQWAPVRAVTASLRDHGSENHFVERLGEAFRERPS